MSIPDMLPAPILFETAFEEAGVVIDFEHIGESKQESGEQGMTGNLYCKTGQ